MFDHASGSNTFGGVTAGVVRTSTGGSPSRSFSPFSVERKEDVSLIRTTEEPLDSGKAILFSTSITQRIHTASIIVSAEKIIFGWGGGLRWGFLLSAQQVFVRWRLDLLFRRPG
ncbi:catenin beta-1-like [Scomber scombrus]|uniref:Catenin beta-1-like n=1 Tax=Scomber scombrus TaxID=13677 RepID=A0AAV1MSB3_SCOSC